MLKEEQEARFCETTGMARPRAVSSVNPHHDLDVPALDETAAFQFSYRAHSRVGSPGKNGKVIAPYLTTKRECAQHPDFDFRGCIH